MPEHSADSLHLLSAAPPDLRKLLNGVELHPVEIGKTAACCVRLHPPGLGACFLKVAPSRFGDTLVREREVTDWLQHKLPVPRVLYFGQAAEHDYLLTSELPGVNACDGALKSDIPKLVKTLAQGLRLIHSLPTQGCPFDQALATRLAEARQRVALGLVDESDFEDEWLHLTAEEILSNLLATQPTGEDLVFTHGDYCMPNVIVNSCELSGFVDWGSGGVADRHQDLALAARSLAYNWGEQWVPLLFEEYGPTCVDQQKLYYFRLLDELF